MTERDGKAALEHDLMLLIHKHAWLTMGDWQQACQSIGEGYLEATTPEAHQLSDEAAARFVEGLAEALEGAGLCEPVAQVAGTR